MPSVIGAPSLPRHHPPLEVGVPDRPLVEVAGVEPQHVAALLLLHGDRPVQAGDPAKALPPVLVC